MGIDKPSQEEADVAGKIEKFPESSPPQCRIEGRVSTPTRINQKEWEEAFPGTPFNQDKGFYFRSDNSLIYGEKNDGKSLKGYTYLYDTTTEEFVGKFFHEYPDSY